MPKTIKELLRERFAPASVLFDSDEYPKNKQYVKWLNTKYFSQDELDKAVNDMLLYRVEMKVKEIFNECIPKPLRESMKLMTIGEYQNNLEQLKSELIGKFNDYDSDYDNEEIYNDFDAVFAKYLKGD